MLANWERPGFLSSRPTTCLATANIDEREREGETRERSGGGGVAREWGGGGEGGGEVEEGFLGWRSEPFGFCCFQREKVDVVDMVGWFEPLTTRSLILRTMALPVRCQ